MKLAFLTAALLVAAGALFHFSYSTTVHAQAHPARPLPAPKALSLPLFFEANQGQTAPQVKFLARGAGYGLFLTADEAVLHLQRVAPAPRTASVPQPLPGSVVRMKLDGASAAARVSGTDPLPGKSNYFIGNDPAKWRRNVPQFARVQYTGVYPGVDLVYYGDQGQLEYDFRVAPAADPSQIALSFTGATTRIDSGKTGDLILSTATGDVRFHAPHVYQPAPDRDQPGAAKTVAGAFRQLAGNKIGFAIGDYDHRRELVIDPILSYSTYLGGTGSEGLVKIAVDGANKIYVAGSTNSAYFFPPNPNNPPIQSQLLGAQNIFIAVIDPTQTPNTSQVVYATYLGGSGIDSLAGIAVDRAFSIYVAGSTTSTDFPTTSNAFQQAPQSGQHGFLSKISNSGLVYGLNYSTYLAGNGADAVTGLAIDTTNQYAYVTGVTTSSNSATDSLPFPAKPTAFQTVSNSVGNPQFFATQINTGASGAASIAYSTYFGGGNPVGATALGGGIAVDTGSNGSTVNMYITGTTNMLQVAPAGVQPFPLHNAYQSCLNEGGKTTCTSSNPTPITDAFVAKINPAYSGANSLIYSTYLGGSGVETGVAIAVDTSSNAYITGSTNSTDWSAPGGGFQTAFGGGNDDAFIAKIGNNLTGTTYPLNYFTYLGGDSDDFGTDIKVNAIGTAYITGSTTSANFPTTANPYGQTYGGLQDAFVASILTSSGGGTVSSPNGDFSTYLGGSQQDQGTGIAIDLFGGTYVAGSTQTPQSATPPFPITANAYQPQLNGSAPDAFVSKVVASSALQLLNPTTSPTPNPVNAGTPVTFTFNIVNKGPDSAANVIFQVTVPSSGLTNTPTATVSVGTGTCGAISGNSVITCTIPSLAVCTAPCTSGASVAVALTPAINSGNTTVSVSAQVTANSGGAPATNSQSVKVVDFSMSAAPATQTINAGDTAQIQVSFKPNSSLGYSATITPTQTNTGPGGSIVTSTTPTFNPTTVTLSGSGTVTTTLSIATVARPITTGSLFRHSSFYATCLPIAGLSLVGLIGAGRKRRRWLAAIVLGVIAGAILIQAGCGSSSRSTTVSGGTQAGLYTFTITGSAGSTAAHTAQATLLVN